MPPALSKGIANTLSIDYDLAKVKSGADQENLYSRLAIVCHYIEKYLAVGTIDEPNQYVKDVQLMKWGPYGDEVPNEVVYFGGVTDKTVYGFGGSYKHVIGQAGFSHPHSSSGTYELIKAMSECLGDELPLRSGPPILGSPDYNLISRCVNLASTQMEGVLQRVEILGKTLCWPAAPPERDDPQHEQRGGQAGEYRSKHYLGRKSSLSRWSEVFAQRLGLKSEKEPLATYLGTPIYASLVD